MFNIAKGFMEDMETFWLKPQENLVASFRILGEQGKSPKWRKWRCGSFNEVYYSEKVKPFCIDTKEKITNVIINSSQIIRIHSLYPHLCFTTTEDFAAAIKNDYNPVHYVCFARGDSWDYWTLRSHVYDISFLVDYEGVNSYVWSATLTVRGVV